MKTVNGFQQQPWTHASGMRTTEEVRARLKAMEQAKLTLLFPPVMLREGIDPDSIVWGPGKVLPEGVVSAAPLATLESLNAEIAALAWVLGEAE